MTSMSCTGSSMRAPFGHAAGAPEDQGDPDHLAVDALAVEHPAVLVELLAVIRIEGDGTERPSRPSTRSRSRQPRDLGVHPADRAVVPVDRVPDIRGRVDAGLDQLLRGGRPARGQEGVGHELLQVLQLAQVLLAPLGVGPHRVVGPVRLIGRVRIEEVEVDERGDVAVVLQPLHEAVRVFPRRLRALGPRPPRGGLRLVQLLEALMEVGVRAGERDGRERHRRVPRVTVDLGDGGGRGRQPVGDLVDPVGGRVEGGHDGRRGRLRPARLRDGVVEERAFLGHALERRPGRPPVAVQLEVVLAERVPLDQDHRAGRPPVIVRSALPDRRRAPERDGARRVRGRGERERDILPRERREVDHPRLPTIGRGDGVGQDRRVLPVLPHRDAERHRRVLRCPDREVEDGPGGQPDLEARRLRRPGHQRLPEDVAQALPAHARRHLGQVLAPEDEPDGLDREIRVGHVGGPDDEVADRAPVTGAGGVIV